MPSVAQSVRVRNTELRDCRVTLMGLGRHGGGLGAARFLARQGAQVTISDAANAEELAAPLAALSDTPIAALNLGGHDEDHFRHTDLLVVNPAVRPKHPCLQIAQAAGVPITSEIELFLNRCPAPVIAVTGTNGKSTTSTMLAQILRTAGRRTWLGGNIGGSLLDDLDSMHPDDRVVLELSSFQLAHLTPRAALPQIAVITNCTENHLDWHDSFADYVAAKKRLLASKTVVLNVHDKTVSAWRQDCQSVTRDAWLLECIPPLIVPGVHNRQNAACAAAAAELAGIPPEPIVQALADFRGLSHRIEPVGEVRGRLFYNDSKSTTPDSTISALLAIDRPVWLLVGGVAKGTSFDALGEVAVRQTRGIAAFGQSRHLLRDAFIQQGAGPHIACTESLREALTWCFQHASPGDAILLSPACASFDQFVGFEDRGRQFTELVDQLR